MEMRPKVFSGELQGFFGENKVDAWIMFDGNLLLLVCVDFCRFYGEM
jgi:hypothetical protein